jgi:hypothetical protein
VVSIPCKLLIRTNIVMFLVKLSHVLSCNVFIFMIFKGIFGLIFYLVI